MFWILRHFRSLRRIRRKLGFELLEPRAVLTAGDVDGSFGDNGVVLVDFFERLDTANAVAVQSDEMIIVAGQANNPVSINQVRPEMAVARFDNHGEIDSSFGEDGIALINFGDENRGGGGGRIANGVAIQPDGKIIVLGDDPPDSQFSPLRFNLIRLKFDGTPDTDFNNSGLLVSDLFSGNDLMIQPDGKIIVVGDAQGELGSQFFIGRLNEEGTFDESFDEDGIQFTDLLTTFGSAAAVARQSDGNIVVAGFAGADASDSSIIVARYLAESGELDSNFGEDGLVTLQIAGNSKATDVAVQDDGKIVVVGSDSGDLVLVRFNPDGSLDQDFGEAGTVTEENLNPVSGGTTGGGLVIQPDDKILVTASGGNDFVVLRYDSHGIRDEDFNGTGSGNVEVGGRVHPQFASADSSKALVLQEDGNIVVVGDSGGDWAILRLLADANEGKPWQNPNDRFDVTGDGNVVPLDVLRIVNELNDPKTVNPQQPLPVTRPEAAPFFDVDGNGFLTPLDALGVINFLNQSTEPEGESRLQIPASISPFDLEGLSAEIVRRRVGPRRMEKDRRP